MPQRVAAAVATLGADTVVCVNGNAISEMASAAVPGNANVNASRGTASNVAGTASNQSTNLSNQFPQSPPSSLPPPLPPTPLVNYFSGVLGGISVTFVGHPFDTIKVRLQTQPTAPTGEGMLYKSTVDCVKQTFRGEGLKGFYAGVASPLLGQMYFRAGSFAAFHYIHDIVESNLNSNLTTPNPSSPSDNASKYKRLILSGAVTGSFITILENPIDVIKTKLQVLIMKEKVNKNYIKPFHNTPSCVKFLVTKYGVGGLFHGFTATLIRNVPANAVFFPVNEIMKDVIIKRNGYGGERELSILERLGCGACAGFSYWVGTCPLDCIKSQMMMTRQEQNMTWLSTARVMYSEGGIMRFYQGVVPLAARSIPACGAMFATVDFARNYLTTNTNL